MSKKSNPGDGSHSRGTKGGAMYGGHFAVAEREQVSGWRLTRSMAGLARIMRARRA